MNLKKVVIFCAALIVCLGLSAVCCLAEEGASANDVRLQAQLDTTYKLTPHFKGYDLTCEVKNGHAYLNGRVEEPAERDLAEDLARAVGGISQVSNRIVVEEGARSSDGAERSSFLQKVTDATTTAQVKSKLAWNKNTSSLDARITTNNGVVVMEGRAKSVPEKEIAGQIAAATTGVQRVDNRISVSEEYQRGRLGQLDLDRSAQSAESALRSVGKTFNDNWIKAKVTTSLAFTSGLDSSGIKTDANGGIVTLSGLARTESERRVAGDVARDISGVQDVRNQLQIK